MCKLDGLTMSAKRRVCEIALEAKPGFLRHRPAEALAVLSSRTRLMQEVLGDTVA